MGAIKGIVMGIFILVPSVIYALDSGCPVKTWEEDGGIYVLNSGSSGKVNCHMTLRIKQGISCNQWALNFTLDLTGQINQRVVCKDQKEIFLGNRYTCKWEGKSKKFNWLTFGSRQQTCEILVNWVKNSP